MIKKKLHEMTLEELWRMFPIILKEYDIVYEQWYAEEMQQLISLDIGDIRRISHIGSTSVEGLMAKPIVDILMEVGEETDIVNLKKVLKQNDWICMSEHMEPVFRITFNKGYTEDGFAERVFHLHIRYLGDNDELYFRDYLRNNRNVAQDYMNLKLQLKEKYEYNRDAYTQQKTDFVKKYTELAKNEYLRRYD